MTLSNQFTEVRYTPGLLHIQLEDLIAYDSVLTLVTPHNYIQALHSHNIMYHTPLFGDISLNKQSILSGI